MAENTESHTIKLLQEMRKEMREGFGDVNTRIDGVTHILALMAGHSADLDRRVEDVEAVLKGGNDRS